MGLESATFSFIPQAGCTVKSLKDTLSRLGAESSPAAPSAFDDFVYRSASYWIDLRAFEQKSDGLAVLSIRIALCNPAEVRKAFRSLLERLMVDVAGTLTDLRSKGRWRDTSSENLDQIELCLLNQQQAFVRDFGSFEAAISGDEVFEAMRLRQPPTPDAPPQATRG